MSYYHRFRGHSAVLAVAAAAAVATFITFIALATLRLQGWPPRAVPGLTLAPFPDGTWGASWEIGAGAPGDIPGEALAQITHVIATVAACALLLCALALVLHACARILGQWRAVAVRCALGARLRQLLSRIAGDMVVGAGAGCVAGLVAAWVAGGRLAQTHPGLLSTPDLWAPLPGVAAVAAITAALIAAVTFVLVAPLQRGLIPAAHSLHGDHLSAPRGVLAAQNALVVLQLAGLLVATYAGALVLADAPRAGAAPLPYPASAVSVPLRWEGAATRSTAARAEAWRTLLAILEEGSIAAAVSSPDAWVGIGKDLSVLSLCQSCFVGSAFRPFASARVRVIAVGPESLPRMGVALEAGAGFTAADTLGAPRAALVSRAAAARLFPQSPVLREQLATGFLPGQSYAVRGVVADLAPGGLGSAGGALPIVYLSLLQHPPLVAETTVRAEQLTGLRAAVRRLAPAASLRPVLGEAVPVAERLQALHEPLAWYRILIVGLMGAGTLIGVFGLAAVMSQVVTVRRRDIATRLALGASPRRIERWLLGKAAVLTVWGVALGVPCAAWLGGVLRGDALRADGDLARLGLLVVAFAPLGIVACWLPGRRAARIEPAEAWRSVE